MNNSFPSDLERIAVKFYDGIATPVAQACKRAMLERRWDDLASMRVDPGKHTSPDSYLLDVSAVSLLRKLQELPTTFDRAGVARENFWKAERECWRSNERLQPYLRDPREWAGDPVVRELIERARKIVVSIIGHSPPETVDGKFGPGATYGDKGLYTTVPDKMSSDPQLTGACYPWLFQWAGTAWASACAHASKSPLFVRGNRFTTVPKDCEKDRGIAVEPSINLFYQLGLGRVLRACLKRAGLDLVKGQDLHRQVACVASIRRHLATLDLKNASDTICTTLVRLLLPWRWFQALESLRSPRTFIDNRWVLLEKFSSMGNGFTFELETLIFCAISKAAVEMQGHPARFGRDVLVYGDDIIVPNESAPGVISALKWTGFTTNDAKSFTSGPFRESCGGDFFAGTAVRPHFVEETPNEPQKLISLANGIRRIAVQAGGGEMDPRFLPAWFAVLDAIPSQVRKLRGPPALGDLVIHDEPRHWQCRKRSGIRYLRVYRPARFRKVSWAHFRGPVVLASAVYGTGDGETKKSLVEGLNSRIRKEGDFLDTSGVTPRDSVLGYKVGWVPFS